MNNETVPMDESTNAAHDALDDIRDFYGDTHNLQESYFGSATLFNVKNEKIRVHNILVRDVLSYQEAVGFAYLQVNQEYADKKNWIVTRVEIEPEPVWTMREEEEEFEPGKLDILE